MQVFDELETLPWKEVTALHDELLREELSYVMNQSDFYKKKFASVPITKVTSVADLPLLPFTTKDEIRESLLARPPLGLHGAAPLSDVVQIQSSSGTTGMPTFVAATRADIETWNSMGARVFFANGFRPRDWVMHGYAMGRKEKLK